MYAGNSGGNEKYSNLRPNGYDQILSLIHIYRPGEKMVYSDSNYYLASRIVAAVSGKKLQDFLLENLFNPLCFQGTGWATCPRGHAMGATGLFIRTEEMLRFGALYLNGGMWEGRRLLSEDWVAKATASQVLSLIHILTFKI